MLRAFSANIGFCSISSIAGITICIFARYNFSRRDRYATLKSLCSSSSLKCFARRYTWTHITPRCSDSPHSHRPLQSPSCQRKLVGQFLAGYHCGKQCLRLTYHRLSRNLLSSWHFLQTRSTIIGNATYFLFHIFIVTAAFSLWRAIFYKEKNDFLNYQSSLCQLSIGSPSNP